MQLIITDGWLARSRPVYLGGLQLAYAAALGSLILVLAVAALYHLMTRTAPGGWQVRTIVQPEDAVQENLELLAREVGQLRANLAQLEALSERVSGLAGIPAETKPRGQGGPLVSLQAPEPSALSQALLSLSQRTGHQEDLMTVLESRLLDDRVRQLMLPTQSPLPNHAPGSRFGWRSDPFNDQPALHTGLDFPADEGTPVMAAAGGVVVAQEFHPLYGNLLEVDHGKEVVTRYAHLSKAWVRKGDLVKRGQRIANVGNTGRSTGPHLHFEVLVRGVHQNPEPFLAAGRQPLQGQTAAALPTATKGLAR